MHLSFLGIPSFGDSCSCNRHGTIAVLSEQHQKNLHGQGPQSVLLLVPALMPSLPLYISSLI